MAQIANPAQKDTKDAAVAADAQQIAARWRHRSPHGRRHRARLDQESQATLRIVIALAVLFPLLWAKLNIVLEDPTVAVIVVGTIYVTLLALKPRR